MPTNSISSQHPDGGGTALGVKNPVQTRAEVLDVITAHRERLYEMGVAELWVFGSAARDELRPESDVDVLVRLSRLLGLEFFEIGLYLERYLGRRVDLGTFASLHERARDSVQREAIHAA